MKKLIIFFGAILSLGASAPPSHSNYPAELYRSIGKREEETSFFHLTVFLKPSSLLELALEAKREKRSRVFSVNLRSAISAPRSPIAFGSTKPIPFESSIWMKRKLNSLRFLENWILNTIRLRRPTRSIAGFRIKLAAKSKI